MLVVPPGSLRKSRRRRVVPAHLSVLLLVVFLLGTSGGSGCGSAAAFSLSSLSLSSLSLGAGVGVQVKDRITTRAKAELLARIVAPVSTNTNSNKKSNSNSNNRDAHEQQILQAVRKVEQYSWIVGGANLQNPLLAGNWLMVWTTSASIAGKTRPKLLQTQTPPEQFLDVKKGLAINAENFGFGFGTLQNSVRADLVPLTTNKVKVNFKEFRVGSPLFSYKPEPGTFQGELSVTYLDDEMRISRGDQGNVFVLLRESTQRTNANRIWQAWKQRW